MYGEGPFAVDVLVDLDRLVGVDVEPLHRVPRVVRPCNEIGDERLRESRGLFAPVHFRSDFDPIYDPAEGKISDLMLSGELVTRCNIADARVWFPEPGQLACLKGRLGRLTSTGLWTKG